MVPSGQSALNELLEVRWFWQKMDLFVVSDFPTAFAMFTGEATLELSLFLSEA